jgi:ATP/maltotriose-dependent transcriptional regulator MalT/DNA-binding SARP family transcriptional activator
MIPGGTARSGEVLGDLPDYHLPRPHLVEVASSAAVVVVEAGAGYGKTTLASELINAWSCVAVEVALHEGGVSASLLAAYLRAALGRAGLSNAAAAMTEAGVDPYGAVDALTAALAGESCAIVIDDAHHADRDGAQLIDRLARNARAPQHLVVLARRLPEGCERLRRAEHAQLASRDLALRPEETMRLCASGFGLAVSNAEVDSLQAATAGWTAAAVLAAARARRTGESIAAVARAADLSGGESSVAAILEEAVVALQPAELLVLAQVARLPRLDRDVVDLVAGAGFVDRATALGVPLDSVGPDRWDMPGPVRDLLAARAPADAVLLHVAAQHYAASGHLSEALQLLIGAGLVDQAAQVLADATPAALDRVDLLEYESVVDRLDAASLTAHPAVLLHLARLYDSAALFDRRTAVLDRLEPIVTASSDRQLVSAVEAERITDLLRVSAHAEVDERAGRFLEADNGADAVTRARALSARARAMCWRADPSGHRDEAAMRRSDTYFAKAAELYRSVGLFTSAATLTPYRAMWIDYALGNAQSALDQLDAALAETIARPRKWAYLLGFRAEVLVELGRYDEAETTCEESITVGDRYGDEQLRAFGWWSQSIIASHLGEADRVLDLVRRVEQHPGEWFEPVSGDFLGDAADNLDRVGHTALAAEYLARAKRDPKDGAPLIAMAEAALLARHGDPEQAEACLRDVFSHQVDPRERWRVTLFRAYAAFRRGAPGAGALAARAFEEAARVGLDQLPLTKEREVTQALLALAVETGQPAALALESASLPTAVNVLGGFTLTRGGRTVAVRPGQGPQLLKLLATVGGRLPAERVIDELWPEADLTAGRNRLRTVLNRLRADAGEVVARDGEVLSLAGDVRVDLVEFERDAHRALALGAPEPTLAVAVARSALARYRGDLLPDDPYEQWAERAREHARRLALDLLDMCADVATEQGDLDEVRRLVEVTIDLAPYEEDRYLRAVTALLEQGRRGAAVAVLARARVALDELGVPVPVDLLRLERLAVA